MRAAEIRDMSHEEILRKETDLREELFNLRFQHGTGQLENPNKIKQTKRDLARVKTVLREIQLKTEKE